MVGRVEVNVERRNSRGASEAPQAKRYTRGFPEVP